MKLASTGGTLSLPKAKSAPLDDLGDYSILLYGREKIGKTSFSAQFPETLFLMFEPGGRSLRIYQKEILNWKQFIGYVDLLEQNPDEFKTIVIDTADRAFKMCEEYMLAKLAIQHASDEDFGKGYTMIKDEFARVIIKLLKLGRGVIFTSHSVEREIKSRNGVKYDRIMPTMPKQAREILEPIVDIWVYMEYDDAGKRVLQLRGDAHVAAGHRLQEHFVGVEKVPMGKTAEEAYKNFVEAFNNSTTKEQAEPKKLKMKIRS